MLYKLTLGMLTGFALMMASFPVMSCTPFQSPESAESDGGNDDLVGSVTEEQLYGALPSWQEMADGYIAKQEVIAQLRKIDKKLEIVVFFGTWCNDSQREVPHLLKIYDEAANGNFSLRMYAVDRSRRDGTGLSDKFHVEMVPTIIFFHGGKELGRIVEYPQKSLEEDFLAIVSDMKPASFPDSYPDDEEEPYSEYA